MGEPLDVRKFTEIIHQAFLARFWPFSRSHRNTVRMSLFILDLCTDPKSAVDKYVKSYEKIYPLSAVSVRLRYQLRNVLNPREFFDVMPRRITRYDRTLRLVLQKKTTELQRLGISEEGCQTQEAFLDRSMDIRMRRRDVFLCGLNSCKSPEIFPEDVRLNNVRRAGKWMFHKRCPGSLALFL